MPITPTYPGVYIEEIPSGVRTITGVATSIAAFIGYFKRGPMDKAVQIFNMGDFSREFGGLDSQSEASYAIQQFFLNGGTEAWVVRTASATATIPLTAASVPIQSSIGGSPALTVTAVSPGDWGNSLRVSIDYKTADPDNLFNLAVAEYNPNNPGGLPLRTEVFRNLSMDSNRSDFVDTVVNDENSGSKLVRVTASGSDLPLQNGTVSGDLSTFPTLTATLTDTTPAVNVTIGSATGTAQFKARPTSLAQARSVLESAIRASKPANPAFAGATVEIFQNRLRVLAGPKAESSARVVFTPGGTDPTVSELQLGTAATSIEAILSAALTFPIPGGGDPGELRVTTSIGDDFPVTGLNAANIAAARTALETALRGLGGSAALTNVRVAVSSDNHLIVISGTPGVTLTFAGTAGDANTVTNLGLDAAQIQVLEGVLSGNLPAPPVATSPTPTFQVQIGASDPATATLSLPPAPLTLAAVATALQTAIRGIAGGSAFTDARVAPYNSENRLVVLAGATTNSVSFTAAPADSTTVTQLLLDTADANVQEYQLGITTAVPNSAQGVGVEGSPGIPPDGLALIGDRVSKSGLYALEDVDLFNILCIPRTARIDTQRPNPLSETEATAVLGAAINYCEERRAMLIVDTPDNRDSVQEIKDWLEANPRSKNAVLYFPRVKIADSLSNFRLRSFGASGTMAGIYARTDSNRGVWKAPAGIEATLTNVQSLDTLLTDPENGTLNPLGINCLRSFPVYGRVAWGARTLDGADAIASEYKYVPVRRLALFIEESLFRGLKWVVFEPNDEPLWAQIRLNVGAFMQNLFRQGAFQGKSPREAYLVKCDKETTTQNDINLGIVNIVVGFAPLKPAEFVILKIQQLAGQIAT
jgi:phage tail sheath protein FI